MSFAKLMQLFKEGLAETPATVKEKHDPIRLATAAVLLEAAHADGMFTPAEDGDLVGYLRTAFTLSHEDAQELLEAADEIRTRTIDHYALTNTIRKSSTLAERIEIVKTMWRMVYSDGRLSDYENYLVRKLADLLGLEHHVMIDAKVAILKEMGRAAR